MNSYTPGPWVAVGGWVEHPDDDVADICTCDIELMEQGKLGRSSDEITANARLIAAAPEMLEALVDLLGWQTFAPDDVVTQAHAAIARARGEK